MTTYQCGLRYKNRGLLLYEYICQDQKAAARERRPPEGLILFLASLFTAALTSQGFFNALFFARLQIEGMTLHFFNDVFRLNLALEAAEGIL